MNTQKVLSDTNNLLYIVVLKIYPKCYTNLGKEEKESKDKSLVRTYRILIL